MGCGIQVGPFWHGLHYYFSRYENRGDNAIEWKTFTICHMYPLEGTTCLCKHFQAYHWLQKSSRQKVWKSFTTLKPNGFLCFHLSKVLFEYKALVINMSDDDARNSKSWIITWDVTCDYDIIMGLTYALWCKTSPIYGLRY